MALELETEILCEIGLGPDYQWFNGSSSCAGIRKQAVSRVAAAIQKHHDAGEHIAAPDADLIEYAEQVAHFGERSEYELTNTWQALSEIIATHIHQAKATDEKRREAFNNLTEYLKKRHPVKRGYAMREG